MLGLTKSTTGLKQLSTVQGDRKESGDRQVAWGQTLDLPFTSL